jgi:hypothetical protein
MSELLNKQFLFTAYVCRLIAQAFKLGYRVTLGEAYRTPEQAARNAAKGVGIKNSLHTDRLALDVLLFDKDGRYLTRTEDYEPLGVWWETQHPLARWGGRFGDGNHFSFTHGGRR